MLKHSHFSLVIALIAGLLGFGGVAVGAANITPPTKGSTMNTNTVIDADAPAITRKAIFIAAPLSTVWQVQTDIAQWPQWNTDISQAELEGPLAVGTVFRWSTAGLDDITSTIAEVVPEQRIVWSGPAQGITAVHVWTFTPVQGGIQVHTEESWDGAPVRERLEFMQGALDKSLESWLDNLKREAEARAN